MAAEKDNIASAVEDAARFLQMHGIEQNIILCYKLLLEEILLEYRNHGGMDSFSVKCEKKKKNIRVLLTVPGDAYNPLEMPDNTIIQGIQRRAGLDLQWSYDCGSNVIVYQAVPLTVHFRNVRFMWKNVRHERMTLIFAIIFNVISIVADILLPAMTAKVIMQLSNSEIQKVVLTILILTGTRLLYDYLVYFFTRMYDRIYEDIANSVTEDLAKKILDMRLDCIQQHGSGLFIQRMINDVQQMIHNFTEMKDNIGLLGKFSGKLIAILWISPGMFVYQAVAIGIMVYIELRRIHARQQDERMVRLIQEEYTGVINEIVRANREIKLNRAKQAFLHTVCEKKEAVTDLNMKMLGKSIRMQLLRWNLRELFDFGFLTLIVLMLANHTLEPNMAIVLYNYNLGLFQAVLTLSWTAESIKAYELSFERLYQIYCGKDFPVERFGTGRIDQLNGDIRFEGVCFSYNNSLIEKSRKTVLKNMDIDIRAGDYVAVTGKSGCGKTTIFNLIGKLYEATAGRVLLDGHDIRDLDEDTIRRNIAFVTQNPYILHMSVRDNFRIVKPDMTEEEMISACRQACIHDDIIQMADGYDSIISEEGANLSGGQRQRIAIAMAILKDAPVILMDEATSALDNITQKAVQKNIASLVGKRTVIVIAHRMSTVVDCKRIMYMSDGRIEAEGDHRHLLEICKGYRELFGTEGIG